MIWLGDYPEDHTTVTCMFTTHEDTGAPVAPNSAFEAADVLIFKNGSATEKTTTNGVTMTSPFNSITGLHCVAIDTSNDTGDGGFWVTGAVYTLVLSPDETVDGVAVAKVIGQFGIELHGALRPTTLGRRLDVSAGGEAGLDWANIGSPTTAVNLSATNIDTDQVVASVSGAVGSVTGAVGSVTGAVGSVAAGGITAASFAANAITAAKLDPDVTTELQAGLATAAALAVVDGIVDDILLDTAEIGAAGAGLTAINLPDQTMNIVGNITGNLSGSVGSVSGAVGSVTGNVGGTINGLTATALADFFDTNSGTTYASAVAGSVVAEIADNAGGSALTAAAIADAVWDEAQADHVAAGTFGEVATEVASILVDTGTTLDGKADAIKAKTDSLTFTVAGQVDSNVQYVNDVAVNGTGTGGDPWGP
jgi:hypothetical protein